MVNLEKLNRKSVSPHSPFKKTCPCTILPPPFFNFLDSPLPPGEVIKIYFLPFKKGRRGGGEGGVRTMKSIVQMSIYF